MKTDEDINNLEWEELHLPYNDNLENYIIKYVIPEVFAFQLFNSHFRGCLCNATLLQHYKSMTDIINLFPSINDVKQATIEILNIKYNLKMINESSLIFERWQ